MEYNNKLPEGVGKKIVEALKKQPVALEDDFDSVFDNPSSFKEVNSTSFEQDNFQYQSINENNSFDDEDSNEIYEDYVDNEEESDFIENDYNFTNSQSNYNSNVSESYNMQESYKTTYGNIQQDDFYRPLQEETYKPKAEFKSYGVPTKPLKKKLRKPVDAQQTELTSNNIPSNIETLTRLISQLPSGVSRQTGAQIIRQTMEAMGLSMNKVLTEAQQTQDAITEKIKENLRTIEEYKNNIRLLEKEAHKNKAKVNELEDIISLFILSDRENRR